MKLKILAFPSFVSAIFPKSCFTKRFLETTLALLVKLLYGTEAEIKTISLVKLCKALPNKP